MELHRGLVRAYDAATHTAAVLLAGSMSRTILGIPVSQQVPPDHMIEGTPCAVAFFAEASQGLVLSTFGSPPAPPLITDEWGPTLTLTDIMRGWSEDFQGDTLDPRLTLTTAGGGTGTLTDSSHGGVYYLTVPNTAGAYARLFLGSGAGGFSTIRMAPQYETIMLARMVPDRLGTGQAMIGAIEIGTSNLCQAGYSSAVSPNWIIWSRDSAGAQSSTPSAIPVDPSTWHKLALTINSTALTLHVDGALACTHSTNLPSNYLEPYCQCYRESGVLNVLLDFAAVIPRPT